MASKSHLVNLDAMIEREDFASTSNYDDISYHRVENIGLRDLLFEQNNLSSLLGRNIRKPDFQRETNHWSPEQVVSLLECFINGDLIPSVILWQSPSNLIFVIDGGHRLSVLRAWLEDDYGDGHISQRFFNYNISEEQKKIARDTRNLIESRIGSWKTISSNFNDPKNRILANRALPIQWVTGDADKAETSFFKINTKGTPLDEVEEFLLKNRKKSVSISARAIIRAGTGHKYWSTFSEETAQKIETLAKEIHVILFDPEIKRPIKTLDLPLGGSKSVRSAIQTLIDLILISVTNFQSGPKQNIEKTITEMPDDENGSITIENLKSLKLLSQKVTGNIDGSLGLHPAIYFYGPSGRHSTPMFMGTMLLIAKKINSNDKNFFVKFTQIREKLENLLINKKELIATILQKHISNKRNQVHADILEGVITFLYANKDKETEITDEQLIKMANLTGSVISTLKISLQGDMFSDDTKSQVFIYNALKTSIKCPICNGYLDVQKSVQYDHITRKQDGGNNTIDNCQLTHPYCNQSIKN